MLDIQNFDPQTAKLETRLGLEIDVTFAILLQRCDRFHRQIFAESGPEGSFVARSIIGTDELVFGWEPSQFLGSCVISLVRAEGNPRRTESAPVEVVPNEGR